MKTKVTLLFGLLLSFLPSVALGAGTGNPFYNTLQTTSTITAGGALAALSVLAHGNVGSDNGVFTVTNYAASGNGVAQLCAINSSGTGQCFNVRNNGDTYTLGNIFTGGGQLVSTTAQVSLCAGNSCANALVFNSSGSASLPGSISIGTFATIGTTGANNSGVNYIVHGNTGTYPYASSVYDGRLHIAKGSFTSSSTAGAVSTLTFASSDSFANAPTCLISANSTAQISSISASALSISAGVSSATVQYLCIGT